MKELIIVLALALSFSASANDCYRKALKNFSSDSVSYQIYNEDISEIFEEEGEQASANAIFLLENKLGCEKGAFGLKSVKCREIVPGNPLSKACFAEGELGYFFVSLDMMERINIIFNRFD